MHQPPFDFKTVVPQPGLVFGLQTITQALYNLAADNYAPFVMEKMKQLSPRNMNRRKSVEIVVLNTSRWDGVGLES